MLRPVLIPGDRVGLILISLVNGALFVEQLFSIPGFGKLTIQGVSRLITADHGTVLVGALIVTGGQSAHRPGLSIARPKNHWRKAKNLAK